MKRPHAIVTATLLAGLVVLVCAIVRSQRVAMIDKENVVRATDALAIAKSFEKPGTPIHFVAGPGQELYHCPIAAAEFALESPYRSYVFRKHVLRVHDSRIIDEPKMFYGENLEKLVRNRKEISEADALKAARKYINTHFEHPQELNRLWNVGPWYWQVEVDAGGHWQVSPLEIKPGAKTTRPNFTFKEFRFVYSADPGGLAFSPREAGVQVESLTGRVVAYYAGTFPITTSPRPSIPLDVAMNNAMQDLVTDGRKGSLRALGITEPFREDKEHLVYVLTFSGKGPALGSYATSHPTYAPFFDPLPWWWPSVVRRQNHTYLAMVDAHTGDVLGWQFYDPNLFRPLLD